MRPLTYGELFAGYGGLGMGVQSVLGGEMAWCAEYEAAPSAILAHHWPNVPNYGDVTKIDWATVPKVDVITGGSPCQDLSHAGKRAGMKAGTRSGLWASMCDAIEIIRPRLVVWENVRGALSAEADSDMEPCPGCVGDADDGPVLRALGRVLGDLAELGYDARWYGLRAADVGAPHGRFRIFVFATDSTRDQGWIVDRDDRSAVNTTSERSGALGQNQGGSTDADRVGGERGGLAWDGRTGPANDGLAHADAASDGWDEGRTEPARIVGGPCDAAADAKRLGLEEGRRPRRRQEALAGADDSLGSLPERGLNLGEHGIGGGVLPVIDGDECEQVFDGFGAEFNGHGTTVTDGGTGRKQASRSRFGHDSTTPNAGRERHGRGKDVGVVGRVGTASDVVDWEASPTRPLPGDRGATNWGQYAPAIARWERVLERPAPAPTEPGPKGGQRLSPRFVEWLMGLPAGHVTDVDISRNDQLKALGNGVVPQQSAEATRRWILDAMEAAA